MDRDEQIRRLEQSAAITQAVTGDAVERSGEIDRASSDLAGAWFGADAMRAQDEGFRTLEEYSAELSPTDGDRLDRLIRQDDARQFGARYLSAVGDPEYRNAFRKMLMHPVDASMRFTDAEQMAVQSVNRVESLRALGTGSTGFPLPFTIDPTIMISNAGVINPIRQVARVIPISTHDWHGINSAGVTSVFTAEATEVADGTPTLVQPVIASQKMQSFVPFSIEAGQDWPTLEHELARLFADSKNVLESAQFLTGTGTNSPGGLLNIGGTGGLTTAQRILTAGVATYAVGDPWLLKAGIPARFLNTATFAAAPAIWDKTYRFVAQGSTTEPRQFSDGDRGGDFLGRPKIEWSSMVSTTTTGSRIMVAGQFDQFVIVDRIGATIEMVPLLMGAANRFPTGQRGAYFYARVGSGTLNPGAFVYLEVQ
jgi:HK97 family phage major capsid protein